MYSVPPHPINIMTENSIAAESHFHCNPTMADDSWRDWFSELEMDYHINYWRGNSLDEEFLRDVILEQPQGLSAPMADPVLDTMSSLVFEQTNFHGMSSNNNKHPLSPKSHVVSYKNSTSASSLVPNIHDPCFASKQAYGSQLGSDHGTDSLTLSPSSRATERTKKTRRTSKTLDHIMSERRRRQELTKKFIALSATIPGLKKMDKAHVLSEANKYVKQLQERVKELEEGIKKSNGESAIAISRCHLYIDEGTTTFCETNSSGCHRPNGTLPDVKASVLGKDILIKIHCGKQKGILLKILSQLQSLHLSIVSSNVLPFGNTLDITIVAQMGDECSMIVKDLVKSLRLALLKPCDVQRDPN